MLPLEIYRETIYIARQRQALGGMTRQGDERCRRWNYVTFARPIELPDPNRPRAGNPVPDSAYARPSALFFQEQQLSGSHCRLHGRRAAADSARNRIGCSQDLARLNRQGPGRLGRCPSRPDSLSEDGRRRALLSWGCGGDPRAKPRFRHHRHPVVLANWLRIRHKVVIAIERGRIRSRHDCRWPADPRLHERRADARRW